MNTRIKIPLYMFYILFTLSYGYLSCAEDIIQIPIELNNKELLMDLNWKDAIFIQGITSSWDSYTEKQWTEIKEVLRKKEIQIYGSNFYAESRRFISDGVFEFAFFNKDEFSKDFRKKFMSYAEKTWGTPSKNIDRSWSGKKDSIDSCYTEWFLKNTHIKFTIFGAEMDNHWISGLCVLTITQQGKYAPLKDIMALKCEGQMSDFTDSTKITPVPPFVILVDLNDNALFRRNRSLLGKITQASDDYLISEWHDKDVENKIVIDRKLDTYEWVKVFSVSNKIYRAVNWGKCEKTDLQIEPKF